MTSQSSGGGGGVIAFLAQWYRWTISAVAGGLAWLLDVFTVHALLVALGLESGDDLLAPWLTRFVWWTLFYVIAVTWSSRLMWREAVLSFKSPVQLWASSHVDIVKRLARRVRWWAAGLAVVAKQRRRHRAPAAVPGMVPTIVPDTSRTVPERGTGRRAAAA